MSQAPIPPTPTPAPPATAAAAAKPSRRGKLLAWAGNPVTRKHLYALVALLVALAGSLKGAGIL